MIDLVVLDVVDEAGVAGEAGAEHRHAAGEGQHAPAQPVRAHQDLALHETQRVPLAENLGALDGADLVGGEGAETLVDEWLKEEGKARYMIDDDEFSRIDRLASFFRRVVGLRAACVIRFGRPVDPFGNHVTDEAKSLAPDGRVLNPCSYVRTNGVAKVDPARDAAYTRNLAEVLVAAYRRETVIMGTQLVAHVLFRALAHEARGLDTFAMLRLREVAFDADAIVADIGATRARLLALVAAGETHASAIVKSEAPDELLRRTLEVFAGYHTRPTARREGSKVVIEDPTLLLYYQNRLVPFAEQIAGEGQEQAARFIARIGARR